MAKLTEEQKTYIVQQLACFDSPSQVAASFFEEFGVRIERMQVAQYNPERASAKTLHEKWRAIFYATRDAFLKTAAKVPIAQQSYRLRSLQRLHDLAIERKNALLAAQLLEQAAKEVGGAFTNTRQLQGPGGGPIPVEHSGKVEHLQTLSDADLEKIARGEPVGTAASGGA